MKRTTRHIAVCLAMLGALDTAAYADINRQQMGRQQTGRQQGPQQQTGQQRPPRVTPSIVYTNRAPAQVGTDIVSWGIQVSTQTYRSDPTRVTISGLPRASRARLQVQDPSHRINLSFAGPKQQAQQAQQGQQTPQAGRPTFGALKQRLAAARNMRTVWETQDAAPDIASDAITNTWQAANKVLPVNQPYVLDWSHANKASGPEQRTIRGHVRGLPDEYDHKSINRYTTSVTTRSGRLAPLYEGFVQRGNLLKTDAYSDGQRTLVKVKGVRALPDGASYTIRNLQTGETVSGKATRYGSFNAVVPVASNAEQQLDITIQLKDQMGLTTKMTRSLGKVTFAKQEQAGKRIGYHFVERAGRALAPISANVKGTTVSAATPRGLPRPEVTIGHHIATGPAEQGTMFNFYGAKNQTVVQLGHVSADTKVQVYQQSPPQPGKAKPGWQPVGAAMTVGGEPKDGKHLLVIDQGIIAHTPLKVVVKRPGANKPYAIRTSMPGIGPKGPGNYGGAEYIFRARYANWLQPETVQRTVAHQGPDGASQVRVQGKLSAPASARVSIVNETTGVESRAKLMREAFTTTVKADPGHKLALKIQFADGTVDSKHLGIVPDAVEPTYQPKRGLEYFDFTKNHIR